MAKQVLISEEKLERLASVVRGKAGIADEMTIDRLTDEIETNWKVYRDPKPEEGWVVRQPFPITELGGWTAINSTSVAELASNIGDGGDLSYLNQFTNAGAPLNSGIVFRNSTETNYRSTHSASKPWVVGLDVDMPSGTNYLVVIDWAYLGGTTVPTATTHCLTLQFGMKGASGTSYRPCNLPLPQANMPAYAYPATGLYADSQDTGYATCISTTRVPQASWPYSNAGLYSYAGHYRQVFSIYLPASVEDIASIRFNMQTNTTAGLNRAIVLLEFGILNVGTEVIAPSFAHLLDLGLNNELFTEQEVQARVTAATY